MHRGGVGIRAVPAGTHLRLGPVGALHRQVRPGDNGVIHIGHTGALAADGEIGAAAVVQRGNGGGHQQAVGQLAQLPVGQAGISLPEILPQDRRLAGHMGRGHGGAGHAFIAAANDGGINQAARSGDLRLNRQIGGRADAAEGADLPSGGVLRLAVIVGGEADGLGPGSQHRLARFLGNADDGDGFLRQSRHKGALIRVVVDDSSHSADSGGVGGLHVEIDGSPLDQRHLAREVQALKIGLLAQAGHRHILQRLPLHGAEDVVGGLGVVIGGVIVGIPGAVGQLNVIFEVAHVVHGSHTDSRLQRRGRSHNGAVRILGQGQLGSGRVIVCGGSLVAGGDHHIDAGLLRPGIHAGIGEIAVRLLLVLIAVLGKAGGRAQGQIHRIGAQLHGVVQTGQDDIVAGGAGIIGKDLHDHQLSIGRHAPEIVPVVAGHRTGHMDAVGLAYRLGIGITICIVIAEGGLFIDVHLVHIAYAAGQLTLQHPGNVGFVVLAVFRHDGEGLMVFVKARVQDGHNGARAVIAQGVGLIGAHHAGRAAHGDGVLILAVGGGQTVLLSHEDALDSVDLPGLGNIAVGQLHGETVEYRGIGVLQVGNAVDRLGGNGAADGPDFSFDSLLGRPQILLQSPALGGGCEDLHVAGGPGQKRLLLQLHDHRHNVAVLIQNALVGDPTAVILGKRPFIRLEHNFPVRRGQVFLCGPLRGDPVLRRLRRRGETQAGGEQREDQQTCQ